MAAQNGYSQETMYGESLLAETPFLDPRVHESEEPRGEATVAESVGESWEFTTPFLPGESFEGGQSEAVSPEVSEFSEVLSEMKDALFREALEQLADEALEVNAEQLAGEYGNRETRDLEAERVLTEHFEPLAREAEAMLDRFFERVEGYEAEALTDTVIARISSEVLPEAPVSPASEQFLGGLLRKAAKLVSGAASFVKKGVTGAINLAGKGLAALGKLALGGLLEPLKALGRMLLKHVVKFAIGQLPPALQPLAKRLSDRLSQAIGETQEAEIEGHEQSEAEPLPAAKDAARLEAEFDVHAAQLLFAPEQGEIDHLVSSYGETENYPAPLAALDSARAQLIKGLSGLQPGESAQPVMEQFIPAAIWPVAKTAITVLGRPKIVSFLGDLLAKLIRPLIGADASGLLAPAIADIGLKVFGLEATSFEPREMLSESLAATVEETLTAVSELPAHVLENETLLSDAVHEAFERAASSYFPNSAIRPGLRESVERHGMWTRMPARSERKRYAKYSDTIPVEVSPRVAQSVQTFGNRTLQDHLRDHHGLQDGHSYKGQITLYQALPGTRGSTIARAEGFPPSQLHPLTPQAAGALLGQNAAMASRQIHPKYLASPQSLHINQRLYRVHPRDGRRHHARRIHSELLINLLRGEIRIWIYLSEPLCQRISAELAKPNSAALAFGRIKPLLHRTTQALKLAIEHHHLPPEILVVSEVPNLENRVHQYLRQTGHRLGAKISEWAQIQLTQYLRNHIEEFKRTCASRKDGVTIRITMTRVPGLDLLLRASQGKAPREFATSGWPKGSPLFQVIARPGFEINRLRD